MMLPWLRLTSAATLGDLANGQEAGYPLELQRDSSRLDAHRRGACDLPQKGSRGTSIKKLGSATR